MPTSPKGSISIILDAYSAPVLDEWVSVSRTVAVESRMLSSVCDPIDLETPTAAPAEDAQCLAKT